MIKLQNECYAFVDFIIAFAILATLKFFTDIDNAHYEGVHIPEVTKNNSQKLCRKIGLCQFIAIGINKPNQDRYQ